jgi:glycosyltransferase involved in cell wall biosynthesis
MRVLELRSVRGTGGGPEKTILLGAAQADPARCHVTVCYIRDGRDRVFGIDARAAALGVEYTEIHERHSFDPLVWPALLRLVRDRRVDIVHAHDYKTDLLVWLLHRWTGARVLATAHGWSGFTRRERRVYYPGDKRLLARFPRVVAVSSLIRDEIVRYGAAPERVSVILNGIDPVLFRRDRHREPAARAALGLEPGTRVVGAIGRLESEKRFDLLVQAFAELHARHPELRLVIAGDGSQRAAIERLVSVLGVSAACRLPGHLTDVRDLHHVLDVCVQSSDTEGTPNAVLEAMAMETPVVATAVGGTAELIRAGIDGWLVTPGSSRELTDTLASVLSDPGTARTRAVAARARVEGELSFGARMAALERVYEAIMGANPREHAA